MHKQHRNQCPNNTEINAQTTQETLLYPNYNQNYYSNVSSITATSNNLPQRANFNNTTTVFCSSITTTSTTCIRYSPLCLKLPKSDLQRPISTAQELPGEPPSQSQPQHAFDRLIYVGKIQ